MAIHEKGTGMTNDGVAAVMEKTLLAIADANVDIVPMLFTRYLAA